MSDSRSGEVSRRDFFSLTLSGAAGLLVPREGGALSRLGRELEALAQCDAGEVPGGRLTGIVPFSDAGGVRFGVLSGRGLDARLLTDLSTLESDRLVTPNESFYVRTEAPASMDDRGAWRITLGGLVRRPVEVALPDLLPEASERGPYVMECAGNGSGGAFGLMSAARWSGISMADVLRRVEALPAASRVLVSGVDHSQPSATSSPGASWIFTLDDLRSSGAFLATAMNGQPLPRDHGYPVRLYVPRWYGCACIKWVNQIVLVSDDEPSTPHMREFGPRTFQQGRPALAKGIQARFDGSGGHADPGREMARRQPPQLPRRRRDVGWRGERRSARYSLSPA